MNRRIAGAVALLTVAGCSRLQSPEQQINEAIPIAAPAQRALEAVRTLAAGMPAEKDRIENDVAARLKIRALTCARGYAPSMFTTQDAIRKALADKTCFDTADADLQHGLSMLRVGLTLALPPLRPLAQPGPGYLGADGAISDVRFAHDAGVAAVQLRSEIQIIDMGTGQPIHGEPLRDTRNGGDLCANGRLIALSGSDSSTRIVDTATGDSVLTLPSTRAYSFTWLDAQTAYVAPSTGESGWLLDFTQGRRLALTAVAGQPQRAVKAPDGNDHYVLFMGRSVARIQLIRSGPDAGVRLIKEQQTGQLLPYGAGTSGVTADRKYAFAAQQMLSFTSLETLDTTKVELAPFRPMAATATPDPDKIILQGVMAHQPAKSLYYVYGIANQTLALIDTDKLASTRFLYAPSLRKQGVITDRRVTFIDALPTGAETPLANVLAQAVTEANQLKLDAATGMFAPAGGTLLAGPAPLADLARDARVEAVGVYQATSPGQAERSLRTSARPLGPQSAPGMFQRAPQQAGAATIRIRRSSQPLVLVLASYDPVRWTLVPDPGAKLAAVLVSGYHESQVFGAGSARVVRLGRNYAYSNTSSDYRNLEQDVQRMVGKRINLFQGRYEGAQFEVGGQ